MTVGAVVDKSTEPPRQAWHNFLRTATPRTARVVQFIYFLMSAGVLWWLVSYPERDHTDWFSALALALFFLILITLLLKLIVPRQVLVDLAQQPPFIVKLGLICNYFAVLLILQIVIATWWAQALTLAGLLGISMLGLWVCRAILLRRRKQPCSIYDPSTPQGRQGRFD
jgi:hypothetical protein